MENPDAKNRKIVFFDGVCHLCNGFVDGLIRRDKKHQFIFAPLQGETAREVLSASERDSLDSVIYYETGRTHQRSEAILRILVQLPGIFKIFYLGYLIPGFARDGVYRWVAKNRYSWFGKSEICRLPRAEERKYLWP